MTFLIDFYNRVNPRKYLEDSLPLCQNWTNNITLFLHNRLNNLGRYLERNCRICKILPHYKYVIRPLYRSCVKKTGPVLATGITFIATDLIFHQLLPLITAKMLGITFKHFDEQSSFAPLSNMPIQWFPSITLATALLALPVMYTKHHRNKRALQIKQTAIKLDKKD